MCFRPYHSTIALEQASDGGVLCRGTVAPENLIDLGSSDVCHIHTYCHTCFSHVPYPGKKTFD